jgi:DNA-binding NarL/FixJ family response regulator
MPKNPRVIIADDHALVAEGIRQVLQAEFDVLECVNDGAALVAAAERLHPDVVVTDVAMPKLSGLEAIRALRKHGNRASAIVVTMHADPFLTAAAISAGASGYVLKHAASDELILAIREVLAGRTYISPLCSDETSVRPDESPPVFPEGPPLTGRQLQVLRLIAKGVSMKQIANLLNISRRTVEAHKYLLMRTLGAHSVVDLVGHAIRRGLISVYTTDL